MPMVQKSPYGTDVANPAGTQEERVLSALTPQEQAKLRGMMRSSSGPALAKKLGIAETTLFRALAYPPMSLHKSVAGKIRAALPG